VVLKTALTVDDGAVPLAQLPAPVLQLVPEQGLRMKRLVKHCGSVGEEVVFIGMVGLLAGGYPPTESNDVLILRKIGAEIRYERISDAAKSLGGNDIISLTGALIYQMYSDLQALYLLLIAFSWPAVSATSRTLNRACITQIY